MHYCFKKDKAKASTLDFHSRALLNDLKTSFPLELTSSISTPPTGYLQSTTPGARCRVGSTLIILEDSKWGAAKCKTRLGQRVDSRRQGATVSQKQKPNLKAKHIVGDTPEYLHNRRLGWSPKYGRNLSKPGYKPVVGRCHQALLNLFSLTLVVYSFNYSFLKQFHHFPLRPPF